MTRTNTKWQSICISISSFQHINILLDSPMKCLAQKKIKKKAPLTNTCVVIKSWDQKDLYEPHMHRSFRSCACLQNISISSDIICFTSWQLAISTLKSQINNETTSHNTWGRFVAREERTEHKSLAPQKKCHRLLIHDICFWRL